MNMETKLGNLKRYNIKDLELEDEDLKAIMTAGLTVSGTFLNLLRLKKQIDELAPDIRVIYSTFSASHLRIVKKEYWEEWNNWRTQQGLPKRPAIE